MVASLGHRGPDDEGVEVDASAGLFMGFRRLSILDLSEAGHQPMSSVSGRYVLTFNGEIYNFRELRRQLEGEGFAFRGHSDTEVILGAFERWGCERAITRFRGMFAFALWDKRDRLLWLARDRMGIKPLYFLNKRGGLAYASEVRAFHQCPLYQGTGSVVAAYRFLCELCVPGPTSILDEVEKVSPGELLKFRIGGHGAEELARIRYWDLPAVAGAAKARPITSDSDAVAGLVELLRESVGLRLIADVPVGAFLSGGVDSTVVVAVMQELSEGPVKTFTIAFDDPAFDEGPAAACVARHLGTNHTSVAFTTKEVLDLIPLLPELSDEPMANPSLLPTLLVSRVARRDVVVALSGDGGDELFGGYNRYVHGARLIRATQRLPAPVRGLTARLLRKLSNSPLAATGVEMLKPRSMAGQQSSADRLVKLAGVLGAADAGQAYRSLMRVGMVDAPLARPVDRYPLTDRGLLVEDDDLESGMMLCDQVHYLPDDLLTKVDRASMWESLEARLPILDQEIVSYSWRLRTETKIRNGITKWPLRQIALRYVPPALLDRPKMGFTVPIARWLTEGLHEWARDCLSSATVERAGLLDAAEVATMWESFTAGRRDLALPLWTAAVLHAWSDYWNVRF